jgi:hypothetical protein
MIRSVEVLNQLHFTFDSIEQVLAQLNLISLIDRAALALGFELLLPLLVAFLDLLHLILEKVILLPDVEVLLLWKGWQTGLEQMGVTPVFKQGVVCLGLL